jgi:hypothetical protein
MSFWSEVHEPLMVAIERDTRVASWLLVTVLTNLRKTPRSSLRSTQL